jgi:nucleotide-binding universal stress UspA family protein
MLMQSQVIVPLDGSTEAETILPHALLFALQTQSVLTLLRVIMPPGEPEFQTPYIPDDWYEGEVSWTKSYLKGLATRLEGQGVHVEIRHLEGTSAGTAISSYAAQNADVQLIALATHGRSAGGRLLLGSVAGDLYASAPTSLLLLHPAKDEQLPPGPIAQASFQTIVVPLDGMASSEQVLQEAKMQALASHASLLLVADPPSPLLDQQVHAQEVTKEAGYLDEQAVRLRSGSGLAVRTAFTNGDPKTFIERLQLESRQPLLIVTARATAEHKVLRFLHQSNVPVLFVS